MSYPFPPKNSMHWQTSSYSYEQAVSEYDAKGHLLDLTEKPSGLSDDQAGSPPTHSLFWEGEAAPIDPLTGEVSHWIEIRIVDEYNQPLDAVLGELTDASGKVYPIRASRSAIYKRGISAGAVSLKFDNASWFKCVEQRKPNLTGDDPVQSWLDDNPIGYRATPITRLNATAGDFVDLKPNQTLAERHHAGQADEIALEADNSYLVRIQGFNYISLRIGVFFDGTGNNTYNALWGKQKLDDYSAEWAAKYQQAQHKIAGEKNILPEDVSIKDLPDNCFSPPNEQYRNSVANEVTNIQKLFELYLQHSEQISWLTEKSQYRDKIYITGIGTDNTPELDSPSNDVMLGIATGAGEYGVIGKVEYAINELQDRLEIVLDDILSSAIPFMDGIGEIVFDVFGFSRGAAAARHFVNVISDGKSSALAQIVSESLKKRQILIAAGFCWEHDYWRAGFVGIFDTVASVIRGLTSSGIDISTHNTDNGGVRLWIDERFVDNVVHIVASPITEYRYDFSLNNLNTGSKKFKQCVVPGAHSDIGGGYYSRNAFEDGFLLPLLENVLIDSVSGSIPEDSAYQKSTTVSFLLKQLEKSKQREAANGWFIGEQDKYYTVNVKERNIGKRIELTAELRLRRLVEGDLSRLYLRLMYGLAEHHGVAFNQKAINVWDNPDDKYFRVQSAIGDLAFGAISELVLHYAKQGVIYPILLDKEFAKDLMRNNLIHHSSADTIGMKPNDIEGRLQYRRAEFKCVK